MLPGSDGFEVCRKIRMNPAWRGVRIIMLTARGRDSERARGIELGADAYITKPFSTRELVEQVKRFLGSSAG
jgi:DNA-binding response OmpR family regulator